MSARRGFPAIRAEAQSDPHRQRRPKLNKRIFGPLAVLIALTVAATVVPAHEYKIAGIEIGHPWSRPTPPTATVGVGYLSLKNGGTTDDRLVEAASPAAERVELHASVMKNGVMTMRHLPAIEVQAGRSVSLEPGGIHLMLTGLRQPLKDGMRVPVTLTFERAGSVEVELAVQSGKDDAGDHGEMKHNH